MLNSEFAAEARSTAIVASGNQCPAKKRHSIVIRDSSASIDESRWTSRAVSCVLGPKQQTVLVW